MTALSKRELASALAISDLTDPADGPHAMQRLLAAIHAALEPTPTIIRASPIVSIADNYDALGIVGVTRNVRYTRYVCDTAVLRTHTSAMIPRLLRGPQPADVIYSCPGVVYRRDTIDRWHVGEPHQVDVWRIAARTLTADDLVQLVERVVTAALPGRPWRVTPTEHPYTTNGYQIDVSDDADWIEIGECGLAAAALVPAPSTGLAIGLGLDRILMLRKAIPDIRLLRATDPRIASQMQDLAPYREVSMMPPVQRDLSIAVDEVDLEVIGDAVRTALGERAALVEQIELVSETAYDALPSPARARLGMSPGQKNALIRITLRAIDRSLTHDECNALRDEAYRVLHRGSASQWATSR